MYIKIRPAEVREHLVLRSVLLLCTPRRTLCIVLEEACNTEEGPY